MTKEELEKEAGESYQKTDKEFMDCQNESEIFNLGYLAGAEPREKRIADLEKENAELKETIIKMNNVITGTFSNLTKAKELLAKWVELYKPKSNTALPTPIQVDTEQFLKEVEE